MAAILLCAPAGFAVMVEEGANSQDGPGNGPVVTSLDDQCMIDYQAFEYAGSDGAIYFPGGYYGNNMGLMKFTNSCTPYVYLYALCADLYHQLRQYAYCVELNDAVVDAAYPEQYKAMGYVLSWNAVTSDHEARVMQTAVWKLSDVLNSNSPNYGIPHYHVDNGIGYPDFSDTPVYPYVNTVYHNRPAVNDPANALVLDALGYDGDGIEKNIMMDGDLCLFATDPPVIDPSRDSSWVTVHLCIERGAQALAVGNTTVSGIRLLITTDNGLFTNEEMFTDGDGCVEFVIGQQLNALVGVEVTACTNSQWPVIVTPCTWDADRCNDPQILIVFDDPDTMCCSLPIPPDNWLSVELTSFDAVVEDGKVVLNWRTASETDLASWEIERCESGSGAFEVITTLPGQNQSMGASYHYADESVQPGVMYDYRLADIDINGSRTVHGDVIRTAGLPEENGAVINEFVLEEAYPNPFNPTATIRFAVGAEGPVSLRVFDITGAEVAVLADGHLAVGDYTVRFNASGLPSGLYFYRLTAPNFSATKRMILLK